MPRQGSSRGATRSKKAGRPPEPTATPAFEVQIASVWMDVDTVDFFSESYDCAILLGAGKFGST